jgi:hypothetical protein
MGEYGGGLGDGDLTPYERRNVLFALLHLVCVRERDRDRDGKRKGEIEREYGVSSK